MEVIRDSEFLVTEEEKQKKEHFLVKRKTIELNEFVKSKEALKFFEEEPNDNEENETNLKNE